MIYWLLRTFLRFVFAHSLEIRRFGLQHAPRKGSFLLACSHVSHLDPVCASVLLPRRIGWLARIEFFRHPWLARLMLAVHAVPLNRQGVPVRAMREALARLGRGEVVGVFPEGELKAGAESVLHGGRIKRGVCLLAQRSGQPVVPCLTLGTEKLNGFWPWVPFHRGKLWIACGEPILPIPGADGRGARAVMAMEIEAALRELFAEVRREFQLEETIAP